MGQNKKVVKSLDKKEKANKESKNEILASTSKTVNINAKSKLNSSEETNINIENTNSTSENINHYVMSCNSKERNLPIIDLKFQQQTIAGLSLIKASVLEEIKKKKTTKVEYLSRSVRIFTLSNARIPYMCQM